ncbi:MAG: sensor histidine kinase, partial [Candidatus Cloacimonadaceae bacterium]|nr:sensor histidine kinase [Candidatus Cloacimonadaceae bacterium]
SVSEYLNDLVTSIAQTFTGLQDVDMTTSFGTCHLETDILFNLGIIITELLTNAYKYAFPDGRKGHINISCKHLENGSKEIIFEDDGIGMPQNLLNCERDSFGLSLVDILVKQIDGHMIINSDMGTQYRIVFP